MVGRIRHDAPAGAIPMDNQGLLAGADRPDIIRRNAGNSIKSVGQGAAPNIRRLSLRPGGAIPVQSERSIRRTISLANHPDIVGADCDNAVKAVANGTGIRTRKTIPTTPVPVLRQRPLGESNRPNIVSRERRGTSIAGIITNCAAARETPLSAIPMENF